MKITFKIYIARNEDGTFSISEDRLARCTEYELYSREVKKLWVDAESGGKVDMVNIELVPNMTWDDEPIEVALLPMSFIKEVNNLTDAICGSEFGRPEGKEKGDVLVSMKKLNEFLSDYVGGKIL